MSVPADGLLKFEGYEIDRARWQLRFGDDILALNRKTYDLLLYLVEHADRVVGKDELLRVLWPDQFIEESNLTQQVFLLRKALSRHASGTRIVETVPGRGYRFAVPVHLEARRSTSASAGPDLSSGALPDLSLDPASDSFSNRPPDPIRDVSSPSSTEPPSPAVHTTGAGSHGTRSTPSAADARRSPDVPARSVASPRLFWAVTALLVALASLGALLHWQTHVPLSISAYTELTHDGHAKFIGGTDGSRIYFTRPERSAIAQVSVAGRGEALLPLAMQDPWSGAVSPDGSTLLIVSQAGGQGPASSLWSLQLVTGSLRRLGNAVAAAWSPDGEEIAYASANGDLLRMHADGTDARAIASVPSSNIGSVAWSPDGRVLRFSRDGTLWQVALDGNGLGPLLPGWGRSPTQWSGDWSPTGDFFFVADGQIWLLDTHRRLPWRRAPRPVQLTHGPIVWDHPVSSRDGKKLFASGRTRRGQLVRFDPGSPDPHSFLGGLSAEFVTFSRAGNAVAYVTFPDGILWRANRDGSNPVQLTHSGIYPKSLCWSPDGTEIAFVDRTAAKNSALFVVRADGSGKPRDLLPSDSATETDPSWSPDGRHLVYSTAPNVGASARADLRLLDRSTGKASVLPGSDGILAPRWSPDGRAIAGMTLDAKSLRVLDLASGRWSTLDTGAVAFPEWTHDSRAIVYVRWTTHPALVRIRVADGRQEVLADLSGTNYTGAYTLWMGLDPDDKPLMLRDTGTDDIYALTLERE